MGAVVGDCLGAKFEFSAGHKTVAYKQVRNYTQRVMDWGTYHAWVAPVKYTDDTAMTTCVAKNLLKNGTIHPFELAKSFRDEFCRDQSRGYGKGVKKLFQELDVEMKGKHASLFRVKEIAGQTHGGAGSHGNGAAMRVCPVAIFAFKAPNLIGVLAARSAVITHTHDDAMDGATLQAHAVSYLLRAAPASQDFDLDDFIFFLRSSVENKAYHEKLTQLRDLVHRHLVLDPVLDYDRFASDVQSLLGNGVKATEAVPAALAVFAIVASADPEAKGNQQLFQNVIDLAISCGGDTDTIASMAGTLAGAWWGVEAIPTGWIKACEGTAEAGRLSADLLQAASELSLPCTPRSKIRTKFGLPGLGAPSTPSGSLCEESSPVQGGQPFGLTDAEQASIFPHVTQARSDTHAKPAEEDCGMAQRQAEEWDHEVRTLRQQVQELRRETEQREKEKKEIQAALMEVRVQNKTGLIDQGQYQADLQALNTKNKPPG